MIIDSDPDRYRMRRAYAHLVMVDGAIDDVYCTGADCPVCARSPQERRWAQKWRRVMGEPEA